jgi:hypothetical protein
MEDLLGHSHFDAADQLIGTVRRRAVDTVGVRQTANNVTDRIGPRDFGGNSPRGGELGSWVPAAGPVFYVGPCWERAGWWMGDHGPASPGSGG